MSLVIELPYSVECYLREEAQKAGVKPEALVVEVVKKNFVPVIDTEEQKRINAPSIALLQSWLAEAPTTPEGKAEAEADFAELKRNLNANRKAVGARLLFPEPEDA